MEDGGRYVMAESPWLPVVNSLYSKALVLSCAVFLRTHGFILWWLLDVYVRIDR